MEHYQQTQSSEICSPVSRSGCDACLVDVFRIRIRENYRAYGLWYILHNMTISAQLNRGMATYGNSGIQIFKSDDRAHWGLKRLAAIIRVLTLLTHCAT